MASQKLSLLAIFVLVVASVCASTARGEIIKCVPSMDCNDYLRCTPPRLSFCINGVCTCPDQDSHVSATASAQTRCKSSVDCKDRLRCIPPSRLPFCYNGVCTCGEEN